MPDPIAPSYSIAPQPVSPTGIRAEPPVQAPPSASNDLKTGYELAIQSKDPGVLQNYAQQARGTAFGDEAALASEVIKSNHAEYDRLIAPIQKAGGVDTPEGRIEAAKTYDYVGKDPKFGEWLIHYLMKDPMARVYAGAGNIKTELKYGVDGQLVEVHRNELGSVVRAKNFATGKELSKPEYDALKAESGVGKVITEERLKNQAAFNADARNLEDKQLNTYVAFSKKLEDAGRSVVDLGNGLAQSGVKPGDVAKLVSFGNQSLTESQSKSKLASELGSLTKGATASQDIEKIKKISAQLGITDVVSVKSDGSLIRKNGETVSLSELAQKTSQETASSAFENATTGNQQQRAMGALFSKLSPPQQQALLRMVDLQSNVTNDYNKIRSEVGDLRFLVNLNDLDPMRGFGATLAKGESMIHNAQMINEYAKTRGEHLKVFEANGKNPSAGEMQAAFTRTAGYNEKADELTKKVNQYIEFDIKEKTAEEQGKAAAEAAKPVKAVAPPKTKPEAKPEEKQSRWSRHTKKD
jgi:hypothetical protein